MKPRFGGQAGQILFALGALDQCKPKERNRRISNQHGALAYERHEYQISRGPDR
jgi:hypothetical protein